MTDTEHKIASHQQAASTLLGVCKEYPELSVADIIFEMEDGQYVSAKEGLVEIIEEEPFEEAKGNYQPEESKKSLTEAGLTVVSGERSMINGFSVAHDTRSCRDSCADGSCVKLTRDPDMTPFRVLAGQLMLDLLVHVKLDNQAAYAVLDPEAIILTCRQQFDIDQPENCLAENVELSFVCLTYALALHLAPKMVAGEILEYFGAVMDLYPDFISFTDEIWAALSASIEARSASGQIAQS